MVSRSLTLGLLGLILVASAQADLNLSPTLVEFEMDGATFHQLVFTDGTGKAISYQQPDGWQYSGNAIELTLHPPNQTLAKATITRASHSQPQSFDDEGRKQLVTQALAGVPKDSTEVNLISQEKNPVRIGGKETFLVIISYVFYGERYMTSVMFMNRGSEQIHFQFVSRAAVFNDLQRAFLESQFSWYNL